MKILDRKEARRVFNGESLDWDIKTRRKITKLEGKIFNLNVRQDEMCDECLATGDWTPYQEIDRKIDSIQSTINGLNEKLDNKMKFDMMIMDLQMRYAEG
jgi:hypothetical protein